MSNVAVILAAGYKAIGNGFPGVPPQCPEALLPIGEEYGDTPLARLAAQVQMLGFRPFAAVGRPGCRYTGMLTKCVNNPKSQLPAEDMERVDQPPWTWEKLMYVSRFAVPLVMPEPDLKSYDNSILKSLDLIGTDWWERLLVFQCDFVWSDQGLRDIVAQETPRQVLVPRRHVVVYSLTPETARLYRRLGDGYWHRESWGWTLEGVRGKSALSPEGKEFAEHVPFCMLESSSACSQDLDHPCDYQYLLKEWLPKHG